MKKSIITTTVLVIIVVPVILIISDNSREDVLKIGFIGPLSGDVADWGMSYKNGLEMALDEINKNKTKMTAVYEDGRCSGKDALPAARKLIDIDKVDVIFVSCSSETFSIAPLTEEKNILLFTSSTHKDAPSLGDYVFRFAYSDAETAKAAAEAIFKKHKNIGILYEQTNYAEGLKNEFSRIFRNMGGNVIEENFAQGSRDTRSQIIKLMSYDIDAIVLDPDSISTGINALVQLRELEFNKDVYGNFFGGNPEVLKIPESEGLVFFGVPPELKNGTRQSSFINEYEKRYGKKPYFESVSAAAYDAMYILKAIEEKGFSADEAVNYLLKNKFSGVLGNFSFDKNGEIIGISPSLRKIMNGTYVQCDGDCV